MLKQKILAFGLANQSQAIYYLEAGTNDCCLVVSHFQFYDIQCPMGNKVLSVSVTVKALEFQMLHGLECLIV